MSSSTRTASRDGTGPLAPFGRLMIAQRVPSWRWLFYVGGVLGIAAGVIAFVWPGITLYVLAIFVSWYLVVAGIFNVVAALAGPKRDWWWVGMVVGVLQLVLGVWALGSTTRQLLLLLNLVGIWMIFFGVSEIFAAFSLRALTEDVRRVARDVRDVRGDVPTATTTP